MATAHTYRFRVRPDDWKLTEIIRSFPPGTASARIREAIIAQYGGDSEDDIRYIKRKVDEILARLKGGEEEDG